MLVFLLRHVAFTAGLALASFVVGARLLDWIAGAARTEPLERAALSVALGLGVFGHLALALGLGGMLAPVPAAIACGAVTLACARRPGAFAWRPDWRWLVPTALFVAASWALTLYPPTQWDATSYHLPAARAFALSHRVAPLANLRFPVFARHAEMLDTLALLFGDDRDAQATQWLMMMASAALLVAAGRRWFTPRVGSMAAALWLGSPLVLALGTSAYVDVGLALFVTAAAWLVWRALDDDAPRLAALAGIMAGFAASTKYTGLLPSVLLLGPIVARRRWSHWRSGALYVAGAAVVGAPWYLLNVHWAGNPVSPFMGPWFGYSPWWTAADHAAQMEDLARYGFGKSPGALVTLPFNLLFRPGGFRPEEPASPLYGLALPLVALHLADPRARRVAAFALVYTLAWFFGAQVYRYLVPILPLAALVTTAALDDLARRVRLGRRALAGTAMAAALAAPSAAWLVREAVLRGLPPATVAEGDAWLAARRPAYRALAHLEPRAPGERLYQLELEDMIWYAPPGVITLGDWFGPTRYQPLLAALGGARELHTALEAYQADWLLVPRPSYRGEVHLPVADPEFGKLFEARYEDDAAALYRIVK